MSDLQHTPIAEWHLEKKVTLGIIFLLVANITSSVWWAATLTNDVQELKERPNLTERVIRLEAVSEEHGRILQRVSVVIDKLDATLDKVAAEQSRSRVVLEHIMPNFKGGTQ